MFKLLGDKYLIWFRIANIFYTDPGVRQGFYFKEFHVSGCICGKWFSISIPFLITGYNRKRAEEFDEIIKKLKALEAEGEL